MRFRPAEFLPSDRAGGRLRTVHLRRLLCGHPVIGSGQLGVGAEGVPGVVQGRTVPEDQVVRQGIRQEQRTGARLLSDLCVGHGVRHLKTNVSKFY